MYFQKQKIKSLAEDLEVIGLIKRERTTEKDTKVIAEKNDDKKDDKKKKIQEAKKKALIAKKRKLLEAKKLAIRKAKAKKIAESKKRTTKPSVKKESKNVSNSLKDLVALEQKLNTNVNVSELMKAFEHIMKISEMAAKKFKKLSEEEAADYNKNDNTDRSQAGKDIPPEYKNMVDGKTKEGNVGTDKEDEQEGNQKETGTVDTITGKEAGKPAHQDPQAQKVKIAEMDEYEDDDESVEEQDDIYNDDEDMSEMENELDMDEQDDELDMSDMEGEDDVDMAAMGDEMGMEDEIGMDDPMSDEDLGGDEEMAMDNEMGMGDEFGAEDDMGIEEPAGMEGPMGDEGEMGDMDDMMPADDDEMINDMDDEMGGEEDEEELEPEMGMESKKFRKAYMSELKDIRVEAEDIMNKIRKHAISPQDAEGVLKDIVVRLGGAVGDLSDMNQFAATDKVTTA